MLISGPPSPVHILKRTQQEGGRVSFAAMAFLRLLEYCWCKTWGLSLNEKRAGNSLTLCPFPPQKAETKDIHLKRKIRLAIYQFMEFIQLFLSFSSKELCPHLPLQPVPSGPDLVSAEFPAVGDPAQDQGCPWKCRWRALSAVNCCTYSSFLAHSGLHKTALRGKERGRSSFWCHNSSTYLPPSLAIHCSTPR